MSISFSGLASGLDTTSWVRSLTQLRQAKVTKLEEEKQTVVAAQSTLQSIRSIFASFRASLEKITDSKFNVSSMDIFAKKLATVTNAAILSATAKSNAAEGSYQVKVNNIATQTKVKSEYRYKTTIVSTTQATESSSLKDVGIGYGTNPESGITAGDIEIDHNDVTSRISISENETMSSFLGKLHDAGINAEFESSTGIFSIDVSVGDIRDIGNTNILNKLQISDINYGYTGEQLKIEGSHEEYHQAESTTLLSDLGVSVGTIAISTANGDYEVTLDEEDTIGSLVNALRSEGIEATFNDGIFSITNAYISDDGTTGLIEHFGLTTPDIASRTQLTEGLKYQTVYANTTTAHLDSLLKDIDGVTLESDQTINIKDAEGNLRTVTVGITSTIGDMVDLMNDAGMTVSYNESTGVLSVGDGWIVSGGTFDVETAFGLQYTGVPETVTGNSLTVTTTTVTGATASTQLKNLSTAVTSGTIKITDTTDTVHNFVINENDTIGELVSNIQALGLGADFDSTTGVLTLTGGSYTTDGIAVEDTSNFLNVFFGSDTLTPNAIDSATSASQVLKTGTITTHAAEGTTTLNQLGMEEGTYTATFTTGITEAEIEIRDGMTMSELVSTMRSAGIDANFDAETCKLSITDAQFVGVTGGNFDTIMNFTETTTGRYVTSDIINSQTVTTGREMTSAGIVNYDVYTTTTIVTTFSVTTPIEITSAVLSYQSVVTTQTNHTEALTITGTPLTYNTSVLTVQTTDTLTYLSIENTPTTTTTIGETLTGVTMYADVTTAAGQTSALNYTILESVSTTTGQAATSATIYMSSTSGVEQTSTLDYTVLNNTPGSTTTVGQTVTTPTIYTYSTTGAEQTSTLTYTALNSIPGSTTTVGQTVTTPIIYTMGGITTAESSSTLADIGMSGSSGLIITDNRTITVASSDTMENLIDKLNTSSYLNASLSNGELTITPTDGHYIKSITSNLETVLGINSGYEETYSVNVVNDQTVIETVTAAGTTTMAQLGLNQDGTVTNSIGNTITVSTSDTIDDVVTKLASLGVTADFTDGVLTVGNESDANFITNISSRVASVLGIEAGENNSYSVAGGVTATESMTLAELGMSGSSGVITTDNRTITVAATDTMGDLIDELNTSSYLNAALTNGQLTITPSEGHYIRSITSNLETILGINSGYDETYGVNIVNGESSIDTITATGTTTMSQLGLNQDGIVVNNTGNTVTIAASDTVNSVVTKLESLGVTAEFTDGVLTVGNESDSNFITNISTRVANILGISAGANISYAVDNNAAVSESTTMAELGLNSAGTIITNNATITIETTDTIGDVINKLDTPSIGILNSSDTEWLTAIGLSISRAVEIGGGNTILETSTELLQGIALNYGATTALSKQTQSLTSYINSADSLETLIGDFDGNISIPDEIAVVLSNGEAHAFSAATDKLRDVKNWLQSQGVLEVVDAENNIYRTSATGPAILSMGCGLSALLFGEECYNLKGETYAYVNDDPISVSVNLASCVNSDIAATAALTACTVSDLDTYNGSYAGKVFNISTSEDLNTFAEYLNTAVVDSTDMTVVLDSANDFNLNTTISTFKGTLLMAQTGGDIVLSGTMFTTLDGATVKGVRISNSTSSEELFVSTIINSATIDGLSITNSSAGYDIIVSDLHDSTISNIYVDNCEATESGSILFGGIYDSLVSNISVNDCSSGATAVCSGTGVFAYEITGSEINNVNISNVSFGDSRSYNIAGFAYSISASEIHNISMENIELGQVEGEYATGNIYGFAQTIGSSSTLDNIYIDVGMNNDYSNCMGLASSVQSSSLENIYVRMAGSNSTTQLEMVSVLQASTIAGGAFYVTGCTEKFDVVGSFKNSATLCDFDIEVNIATERTKTSNTYPIYVFSRGTNGVNCNVRGTVVSLLDKDVEIYNGYDEDGINFSYNVKTINASDNSQTIISNYENGTYHIGKSGRAADGNWKISDFWEYDYSNLVEDPTGNVINLTNGESFTIDTDTTIDDLCNFFNDNGMEVSSSLNVIQDCPGASFSDGVLTLGLEDHSSYILSMSNNLASALGNIQAGNGYSYTVTNSPTGVFTATNNTTMAQLGLSQDGIIVNNAGNTVSILTTDTVSDVTGKLNSLGITAYYTNGTLTVGNESDSNYITNIAPRVANVLGIYTGDSYSYNIANGVTATESMTMAQLGMMGSEGTIITDSATITVRATDTVESVMFKLQHNAIEETYTVSENAGTIDGMLLEEYAALHNGFLGEIDSATPQVTVTDPSKLYSAITSKTIIGIGNAETFAEFAKIVNGTDGYTRQSCSGKTIVLTADIDISTICADNTDGEGVGGWNPIDRFAGTFNGNGHTISGLYINRPDLNNQGLFSYSDTRFTIKNVKLEDVNITGKDNVGGLIGQSQYGCNITNCSVTGTVSGNSRVGGLAGEITNMGGGTSPITCSYSECDVSGNGNYVGGIAGYINDYFVNITDCYSTGDVITSSGDYVGGLTGYIGGQNNFTNSYTTGNIIGGDARTSGLCGGYYEPWTTITDSFTTGFIGYGDTGISAAIEDGVLTITPEEGHCIMSMSSNLESVFGMNTGYSESYSTIVNEGTSTTTTVTATGSTTFGDLGMTNDAYVVVSRVSGKASPTVTITTTNTIAQFCNKINTIMGATDVLSFSEGSLIIGQFDGDYSLRNGYYIESMDSNLAEILGFENSYTPVVANAKSNTLLSTLGLTGDGYICTNTGTVTITTSDTIDDVINNLNKEENISTDFSIGCITIESNNPTVTWIESVTPELAEVLGITVGEGYSYNILPEITETFTATATTATTLDILGLTGTGTIVTEYSTLTISATDTLQDVMDALANDYQLPDWANSLKASEAANNGFIDSINTITPERTAEDASNLMAMIDSGTFHTIGINNADTLYALAEYVNSGKSCDGITFVLTRDIDLTSVCSSHTDHYGAGGWLAIGDGTTVFEGDFCGNGHTISGLFINKNERYQGLFGNTAGNISDLHVEGTVRSDSDYTGMLVGCTTGNLSNCYVEGNVTGIDYTGLLAGHCEGDIEFSHASGIVSGNDYVGGLAGEFGQYDIISSYSSAEVSGGHYTGGIVGILKQNDKVGDKSIISSVFSKGTVSSATEYSGSLIGGIVNTADGQEFIETIFDSVAALDCGKAMIGWEGGTDKQSYDSGQMSRWLSEYETFSGISTSFADGQLTIGKVGDGNYIKTMSSNLISLFGNIDVGESFSYTVGEDTEESLTVTTTPTSVTSDTTLRQAFGSIPANSKLNLSNGEIVTLKSTTTIADFLSDINSKGMTVTLTNGIFNIAESDTYITGYTGFDILSAMNIVGSTYQTTDLTLGNTKLKDLRNNLGNSLNITSGEITAYKNGIANTITISNESTLDELAAQLSSYNIQMTYGSGTNGRIYFTSSGDSYLSEVLGGTNLLSALNTESWTEVKDSESNALNYTTGSHVIIDSNTKLVDLKNSSGESLGITTGKYKLVAGGINYEGTITASTSVNDFFTDIARYGLTGSINSEGQITLNTSDDNTYLANANGAEGYSNIVDTIFPSWTFGNIYVSGAMDVTETSTDAITRNTRFEDIDGTNYVAGNVQICDAQTGDVLGTYTLGANSTVGDFMDAISVYGFTSYIDNGQLAVRNDGYKTLVTTGGCNALEILGINPSDWEEPGYYTGSTQTATTYNTVLEAATRSTLLSNLRDAEGNQLCITTGEYIVHSNGLAHTLTLSSTDITLDSFMNVLENYGINTIFDTQDGQSVLKTIGNGDSWVESSTEPGASNIINKLFNDAAPSTLYNYSGYEQTTEIVSTTVVATLGTSLSDYDNGENLSEGIFALTVNGNYSEINITSYDTFGSLIDKFQRAGVQASLTDGVLRLETGNRSFSVDTEHTTSHLLDNLGLNFSDNLGGFAASSSSVTQTTTRVEDRLLSVAGYADYDTAMNLLNISTGTLSVYRNGAKKLINIDSSETFGDLRTKLQAAFGDIDIDFADGKLRFFSTTEGVDVQVGSSNDTSNISSVCGFTQDESGCIISAREMYKVNTSSKILTSNLFRQGDVTEGTFVIGDATFTIDSNTTMQSIVAQINSSEKANASAYWDSVDGRLVISSRNTGASIVNIEAGTSNFTDILGFTASEWNPDGSISTTRINLDSQELGTNAKFSINGTNYQSTSNVITSDVSRIQGLTLNLKSASAGSTVTVNVSQDSGAITEAVSQFVESYNELVDNVEAELSSSGELKNQNELKFIKQQIRDLLVNSFSDATSYRNLSALGISTSAGNSATASDVSTSTIEHLLFDAEKFMDGYNKNAEDVKNMLVGNDSSKGILLQIENIVANALSSGSGYFAAADRTYTNKITTLNERIKKANQAIEAYRARLEQQFKSMDMLISQMQNQYSSFLSQGYTTTTNSNNTGAIRYY